jgi:hypothetical protein
MFWRRGTSAWFDVRHLAVNTLGFSAELSARTLKSKVKRCADVLRRHEVLAIGADSAERPFHGQAKGRYVARFVRGAYFRRLRVTRQAPTVDDSPLCDPLRAIGFDSADVSRILRRFSDDQIQLWADVTLAAIESKGSTFFRRSPQAFFMDNIQHAAKAGRTPPDWFWTLRKEEDRLRAEKGRRAKHGQQQGEVRTEPKSTAPSRAFERDANATRVAAEMTAQFRAAGQSVQDARKNAQRFAAEYSRRTVKTESS